MLRIEFKKKNKNNNKSAKGAYEYITRSGLNRKEEIAKSTDLIFTSSKIPVIFEKENQFWNTIDKNERKNGRVNSELLISLPRELSVKDKVEMIEDFIKNTLNKNTSYSYAIHNPVASDGLPNPHCHLMLYEKNFPRNFYNEELSKEINKKDFNLTFVKNGNYIEKEKSYREKAFIYKARENYEELIFEKSNDILKKQMEKFAKTPIENMKDKSNKNFFILKTEQLLEKLKGEKYMENIKNFLNNNEEEEKNENIEKAKEYFKNLTENELKDYNKFFPAKKDFFELMKKEENKILTDNEIIENIKDINIQGTPNSIINEQSDLLNIDKNIRETTNLENITNKYIYDKILTKVFKDENFNLDNKKYFLLNDFFKNMKEEFKINEKEFINNSILELKRKNGESIDETYKKINVKEIELEKFDLECIKLENKFNEKEKDFFSNENLVKELKFMYYDILTANIDEEEKENISFDDFFKNLQENIKYNYEKTTKDFIYTNLFYKVNTNYFAEFNKNEINNDYLSNNIITPSVHLKNFEINQDFIKEALNKVAEKNNIKIIENFTEERKGFIDTLELNIKANVTYLNKTGNINENMIYFKALEDREKLIETNLNKDNLEFQINFKEKEKDKFVQTLSYEEFLSKKKEKEKKKIENGLNSSLYEKKEKLQEESFDFRKNLRPSFPLFKVKLNLIADDNKDNLKKFILEDNKKLLNLASEFKAKNHNLIINTPSVLEIAYNHSKELSKHINLEKDFEILFEKSITKNLNNENVFSQLELKKNIKYNFVDTNKIEKINDTKNNIHYKLTKNVANKILDKNYAFTNLQHEYNLKNNISKLSLEKSTYTYFGFSNDIKKMNETIKKNYYTKQYKKSLIDKTVQNNNVINTIINFNNFENNNISNIEKINDFFNFNTIGNNNLKKYLNLEDNIDNFLLNNFQLKKENEQIQSIIREKIKSDNVGKVPFYRENEIAEPKESFFYNKNIEMLSLQYYLSTTNISENEEEDPSLDSINNLSKLSLANMKTYVDSRPRKKEDEIKIDNKRIEKYTIERENIISRKEITEEEYRKETNNISLNQHLSTLDFIKFKLEWEKEDNEDDETNEYSLKIKPSELSAKNKDYLFADEKMFKKNILFKIYITTENIDKQLNINTLNNNISGSEEEITKIAENNIIKAYFKTRIEDNSDNPEKWNNDDVKEIKRLFQSRLEYEKERITNDQSLMNCVKEYVANNEIFQKIRINLNSNVEMKTSIQGLQSTLLGQKLANELQKHIYSENAYIKETYKYKNQKMKSLLEVNELEEDELTIKRKVKEIDYFNKNAKLLKQVNEYYIESNNDNLNSNLKTLEKNTKVRKDIRFGKEYSNLDFDISPKSYEMDSNDFKNNLEIVKGNKRKIKLLKDIEKSL